MRNMIKAILQSPIPVTTYVYPPVAELPQREVLSLWLLITLL